MSKGLVYLIHFDRPYKHAAHYIGWTSQSVEERFAQHVSGNGARLIEVVVAAGIGLQIARVWPDQNRKFERKLKNRNGARRICPICQQK
jgi:predicted GIY-YIG superfamily endonuclease